MTGADRRVARIGFKRALCKAYWFGIRGRLKNAITNRSKRWYCSRCIVYDVRMYIVQSITHSLNQPLDHSLNQSITHLMNHSTNWRRASELRVTGLSDLSTATTATSVAYKNTTLCSITVNNNHRLVTVRCKHYVILLFVFAHI